MNLTRRELLKGFGALGATTVVNLFPDASEAKERSYTFLSSALNEERIAEQKKKSVHSLIKSIPSAPELDYLHGLARDLKDESQMYIPDVSELRSVVGKSETQLNELAQSLKTGSFGIFIFADIKENKPMQRMYVVQKKSDTEVQFVKGYKISASAAGFSNEKDSGKSPVELLKVSDKKQGTFGEVVAKVPKNEDLFVAMKGTERRFIKTLGAPPPLNTTSDTSAVVTDQYLLTGPNTDPDRGIRIHGSNRTGKRLPDGSWQTFLDGETGSGGCFRMSNTDVRDLALSGYIGMGTMVRAYATPVAMQALPRSSRPRRRIIQE